MQKVLLALCIVNICVLAAGGAAEASLSGKGGLLEAPDLQAPIGSIDESRPDLVWSEVNGATAYIATLRGPNGAVLDDMRLDAGQVCTQGVCVMSLGSRLESGYYTWRVRAADAEQVGPASMKLAFSVTAAAGSTGPEPLDLTATMDGSCVTLAWKEIPGVTSYDAELRDGSGRMYTMRFSADSVCTNGVCRVENIWLRRSMAYAWKVRSDGAPRWSPEAGFRLD
jgi:hypothetical protein